MKIICDTNILLYAAKQKADLVSALKEKFGQSISIYVPTAVTEELASLSKTAKKGYDRRAAKLALQIIEFFKLKEVRITKPVDKGISELAKKEKALVATNDRLLRKLLKSEGVETVFLRQGRLLSI